MSHKTTRTVHGVSCDYRGCDATLEGEDMPYFGGRNYWDDEAVAEGWTIWAHRSREHRCPRHPMRSPKARLVAGQPR